MSVATDPRVRELAELAVDHLLARLGPWRNREPLVRRTVGAIQQAIDDELTAIRQDLAPDEDGD